MAYLSFPTVTTLSQYLILADFRGACVMFAKSRDLLFDRDRSPCKVRNKSGLMGCIP
jgi:hypothetical protein